MSDDFPLTEEEFWGIYKKVPRLTIEIVLVQDRKVYLTLRDIEPRKGSWHIPGGTVHFGESLAEAVSRVAKREIGIIVEDTDFLGPIEYPSHYLNGLDHPVGLAFLVKEYSGTLGPNGEAADGRWFDELPDKLYDEHRSFIGEHKILN